MDDLISRQAAIDALWSLDVELRPSAIDAILNMLNGLPSVQPERKKGKWIRHPEVKNIYGGVYIECSECGEKYVVQHLEDEKFCRNCGADMRGEEDADRI